MPRPEDSHVGPRAAAYEKSVKSGALRQGEVLSGLCHATLDLTALEEDKHKATSQEHPYVMVMSQNCDLALDFGVRGGDDKKDTIASVLFCYVVEYEGMRGAKMMDAGLWKRIRQQKHARYQYLQSCLPEEDLQGSSFPALAIDFKQYFTQPTGEVYFRLRRDEFRRRCVLTSPYLEHLSTRFAAYLTRVALVFPHD